MSMEAMCAQLTENGWTWLTNIEDLCRFVYGTDDLRRVELKVADPPHHICFGQPTGEHDPTQLDGSGTVPLSTDVVD